MEYAKIGMGQLLVEGGEPERNLERASELIESAASQGCQLILLPETLDLGWTHPSVLKEAAPVPGRWSEKICKEAQKNKIYLCAGLTEKCGAKVFNSAIFVNPLGEILLKYRKINLLDVELPFYSIGTQLSVLETEFGTIGVNICADNYFDSLHLGHSLARMGAQLLLSPSSWTVDFSLSNEKDPYGEKWLKPFTILSRYHGMTVASTTSVGTILGGPYEGKKMIGCSLAVGPQGVLARGPYNEVASQLIVATLPIPKREEKGTGIGKRLAKLGYAFDELPRF
jgi:predicted amidohydrolase